MQILGSLNASAEPCQDIWEFGCGGWLQNNPIPDSRAYWDSKLEHHLQVKGKVRTLLNTLPRTVIDEPNSVVGKMKRFYDSCMATEYIEPEGSKPLLRIISVMGGWQVLRTFQKNEFDFPRISPAGLSLPDKKYYFDEENKVAEAFQDHLKDVAQSLGANSVNAQQFAKELINYERRIAEVTPSPESLRDPVESFQKVTVSELRGMSSTIFWNDLLKSMFPGENINDNTEILILSKQYLTDISGIISSTDSGIKNNYLMWHLTKKYLPYLSREYSEAYDIFLRQISGRRQSRPRWEFCMDETLHYFTHAADFLLKENCQDRSERVDKVNDMFESMRHSLVDRINEATTKFDESLRNRLLDKLRLMTAQVGTTFTNQTDLKNYYLGLDLHKNEWFTNVVNAIEFERTLERKTLISTERDAPIRHLLAQQPINVQFLPTSNLIVIPELILQQPVLQLGSSHLPLLLGSVGVEIGEAIAQAFGIEQGLYGPDGKLMSDKDAKVQIMRDLIDQRRTCLVSFFVNIRLDDADYIERTSLDSTMHLAGIQIALDALVNHDLGTIFLGLPALENLPPNALFFLSYVQSQCSVQTLHYHELEHYSFTTLSHDHRTKGILRQLVGFTEAMECPSSSDLYADFSCGTVI
ncbi:Endothelin-converting enzyme 1 [Orchesella cincta]|uniref:Endothelin-converting enzyme 1 n=1 Tax=Orchesella cincta TaxID=48709 RepID=A0A1D2MLB8_ORCCI|nr:Endothelin-converting enzyme 1 [Orchesella cincta]